MYIIIIQVILETNSILKRHVCTDLQQSRLKLTLTQI